MAKIIWKSETRKIGTLTPAKYNPRRLTEKQTKDLVLSLDRFSLADPIVINADNTIIGGHQRIKVLITQGVKEVDVRVPNRQLTENEEKELNLRLNKNLGEWDFDLLIDFDKDMIADVGFDSAELDKIFAVVSTEKDDEVPPVMDDPKTKPGDIYLLGRHRVMCGDSAKIEDVEKLMDGKKADMVFTDPPYGVSYKGKTKDALKIENDDVDASTLSNLIKLWFDCIDYVVRPGGYLLATVPPGPLHVYFANDWKERGWLRQILVWNKSSMVLGRSEYHYKHEPILFGWKEGPRLKNTDRTKTSVWDFDKPSASKDHPTKKPVAMWEYGILNHSEHDNIIFEPFAGSGTTIIACEKTSRICYGMEIDPKYCDVIIQRWENFTGKKAVLENG